MVASLELALPELHKWVIMHLLSESNGHVNGYECKEGEMKAYKIKHSLRAQNKACDHFVWGNHFLCSRNNLPLVVNSFAAKRN